MSSKKNLSIDKERLVRLQDQQNDAATGGEGHGSTTIEIDVPMLNVLSDDSGVLPAAAKGSCCNKSCN